MADAPAPPPPLPAVTDHTVELKACRKVVADAILRIVDAQIYLRRALLLMPASESQAALSKATVQKFQVTSEPLHSLIILSSQLEALMRGGDEVEIQKRMASNLLTKLSEAKGGLAVVVEDGAWAFQAEEDPTMKLAKDRMADMMSRYGENADKPPED